MNEKSKQSQVLLHSYFGEVWGQNKFCFTLPQNDLDTNTQDTVMSVRDKFPTLALQGTRSALGGSTSAV